MKQTIIPPSHTATTPPSPGRLYYLDAARSVLIMMGILLHAANIYASHHHWLVHDGDSVFFAIVTDFLHLFRMPAFFIISGFFCAYTIPKYSLKKFLRVRLVRLLVPFLTAAVTLNLVQILVSQQLVMPGVRALPDPLPVSFWLSPDWIYHLWFLLNLAVYFLLSAAILATPPLHRALQRVCASLEGLVRPNLLTWLGLVLLPAVAIECLDVLGWLLPVLHQDLIWLNSPMTLLYYGVFFILGLALCRFRVLLTMFTQANIGLLILTLLIAASVPFTLQPVENLITKAAITFEEAITVVLLCQWVMLAFKSLCNRPSRIFRYLADASYSIYLFHHLCVVVVGIALLGAPLPIAIKFLIVTTATIAITLTIHHVAILRVPILRFLFNGRYERYRPRGR